MGAGVWSAEDFSGACAGTVAEVGVVPPGWCRRYECRTEATRCVRCAASGG